MGFPNICPNMACSNHTNHDGKNIWNTPNVGCPCSILFPSFFIKIPSAPPHRRRIPWATTLRSGSKPPRPLKPLKFKGILGYPGSKCRFIAGKINKDHQMVDFLARHVWLLEGKQQTSWLASGNQTWLAGKRMNMAYKCHIWGFPAASQPCLGDQFSMIRIYSMSNIIY